MKRLLLTLLTLIILLPSVSYADLWGGMFGPGWGTLTDTKYCTYDSATNTVICNSAGGSGGSGAVSTDSIWAAAGDLVYGTGNDTASILSKGTAYQLLMMNSGATAPAWTSTLGATGTRLTGGFFTDLTVTNAIAGSTTGNVLNTLAEAKGDLAVASANDTWGRLAVGATNTLLYVNSDTPAWLALGAANTVLTSNGSALAWASTHSHSNSAAQFYDATHTDYLFKVDPQYLGGAGTATIQPVGAYALKYTLTGATEVTFPTSGTLAVTGGALGTPSFTALNMPSSNADPGTTAGQIKHDSTDTDSSSGGTAKWYDGAQVRSLVDSGTNYTYIIRTEYIPVAYMEDGATAPTAATVTASTRKVKTRNFSATADNDLEIHWMIPDDYVGGIKFRTVNFVTASTAPADTEVIDYTLEGCSIGTSDALGCTAGTHQHSSLTVSGSGYAQYDRLNTAWSSAITITDAAAGESAMLKLTRLGSSSDTYNQALGLAGIEIKYQAKIMLNSTY